MRTEHGVEVCQGRPQHLQSPYKEATVVLKLLHVQFTCHLNFYLKARLACMAQAQNDGDMHPTKRL